MSGVKLGDSSTSSDAALWVQVLQLFLQRVKINSICLTQMRKKFSNSNPPFVGNNWDSPALYLAQFCVRNVDLKRQAWNPDGDLQRSTQILICEVHQCIHLAFHFLAIDKNIVTSVRNLRGGRERERRTGNHCDKRSSTCNPGIANPKPNKKGSLLFMHVNDGLLQQEQLNTKVLWLRRQIMLEMPKDCILFMKLVVDFLFVMQRATSPSQCCGTHEQGSFTAWSTGAQQTKRGLNTGKQQVNALPWWRYLSGGDAAFSAQDKAGSGVDFIHWRVTRVYLFPPQ